MTPRIITGPCTPAHPAVARIPLRVERRTLAKRRWQEAASDGVSFGFDLKAPLHDGEVFFAEDDTHYFVEQMPEQLLEIELGDSVQAARTAWSLGNLHFPIEVSSQTIRVVDDEAVRLYLERQHLPFASICAVFQPLQAASGHSHGHTHEH